jgi:hypothetical protein
MEVPDPRQRITMLFRLGGQLEMGPHGVFDQSSERMSAPACPPVANALSRAEASVCSCGCNVPLIGRYASMQPMHLFPPQPRAWSGRLVGQPTVVKREAEDQRLTA